MGLAVEEHACGSGRWATWCTRTCSKITRAGKTIASLEQQRVRHGHTACRSDCDPPSAGCICRSKGCGIVEYDNPHASMRAIRELNNTELKGRLIFVREDREDKKMQMMGE